MTNSANEKPIIYLLSTCPRCRNLKQVLEDLGVDCEKVMVDLLSQIERDKVVEQLKKHQPRVAFPVIQSEGKFVFAANADDAHKLFGSKL
jgi:glutaredoxin-like protein NrdH